MIKNTAGQKVGVQAVNATTGAAFTGTVTVHVTGDAGTQALGSVGSGVCAHEGNGYHTYAPAQAETNYDLVAYTFIGTGMIPQTVQVYPTTAAATPPTASAIADEVETRNVGIDLANVANPTTTLNLSGTTIKTATDVETDTADLQSRTVVALSGGLVPVDVQAFDASTAAVTQFANALLGAGTGIPVNVTQWLGATPTALSAGRVVAFVNALAAEAITSGTIAPGAFTASKLGSDFFNAVNNLAAADATVVGSVFKLLVDKLSALTYGVGTGINANVIAMGGSTAWVQFVLDMMESSYVGTIGSATATTIVDTGLSGTFADHYKDREIVFLTGNAAEQAVSITTYDEATNTITHSGVAAGATPTAGDKYAVR